MAVEHILGMLEAGETTAMILRTHFFLGPADSMPVRCSLGNSVPHHFIGRGPEVGIAVALGMRRVYDERTIDGGLSAGSGRVYRFR